MSDIAIIIFLLLIAVLGWKLGAIKMLGKLGSWVAGYLCARAFSSVLAVALTNRFPALMPQPTEGAASQLISMFIDMDVVANRIIQIFCFVVIFVVVAFVVRKLCSLISDLFSNTLLGLINSGIGAGLGFCLAVLVIGIVVEIVLPSFGSFEWSDKVMEFFASSQYMMGFVHDMLALFVANIPAIHTRFFQ